MRPIGQIAAFTTTLKIVIVVTSDNSLQGLCQKQRLQRKEKLWIGKELTPASISPDDSDISDYSDRMDRDDRIGFLRYGCFSD
ncbi:MAG: hypothetical protein JWM11_5739 [Planctomycetaceae bacterium]|nr:hypothetical protein [Planctomycetaceae bacterium]